MINREDSEISTYSNCSNYTSDADDEFEETSNTSSALSSLNCPIDVSDVKLDVVGSEEVLGDIDVVESRSISIDIAHSSITTPSLDRSQLRLDIRDQSEWQCEENRKLELLLAEMRTEIQDEIISFESEIEDAIKKHIIDPIESPFSAPESPQTAAARVLARIGDEVKDHYEQRLQEALGHLFPDQQQGYFNYDNFRRIANDVIDENLPGWRQRAVMNFDPSQSSESPLSPESLEDIPILSALVTSSTKLSNKYELCISLPQQQTFQIGVHDLAGYLL
ncbi:hypothetical protein KUTeg_007456 [Tegillarca granosa]|uniref:Uncharacterized protein n=1 Tax=Tegillarca granosa TaxID=220873 RepID=A0ABQ9FDC7_TEGGR|nr:hypothetical protein KUTeg_007456 [Tegillarca granosa]